MSGTSSDPYVATALTWNDRGEVSRNSNAFGIQGQWVLFDDCAQVAEQIAAGTFVCPPDSPTPGCCAARDPSLFAPAPDQGAGFSVSATNGEIPGKICVKGSTARVLADAFGQVAHDAQWGINVGLPLAEWQAFDASVSFVGGPIAGFRMVVDGPRTSAPVYVTVATLSDIDYGMPIPVPAGRVSLLLSEAKPPDWLVDPPPLDRSEIYELIFHVGGTADSATPYEFCVSELQVLQAAVTP
jgi:hypothetical protein